MESYLKGGLGGVQCTLYSVYRIVFSVKYTAYSVQCTSYSVQCTVKSIQRTVYSVQCTVGLGGQPEKALEEDTSFSGNKLLLDL